MTVHMTAHGTEISHGKEIKSERILIWGAASVPAESARRPPSRDGCGLAARSARRGVGRLGFCHAVGLVVHLKDGSRRMRFEIHARRAFRDSDPNFVIRWTATASMLWNPDPDYLGRDQGRLGNARFSQGVQSIARRSLGELFVLWCDASHLSDLALASGRASRYQDNAAQGDCSENNAVGRRHTVPHHLDPYS